MRDYKIFKILFFLCVFTFLVIHNINSLIPLFNPYINNNFDDTLPRINLNVNSIPSKEEIFKNRELFISNKTLTTDYIKYIKPITFNNETFNKSNFGLKPNLSFMKNRKNLLNIEDYYNLCRKQILISNVSSVNTTNSPLISVIIIAYNKEKIILKSLRSIQNQSLKNIEIIIVNDHSTDDSSELFKQLLISDGRIRIFTHLNNMGAWRSRLDGFLYSNAPYVIHFDAGDFYADNYVLEDIYYIANKYQLDSVRFAFRLTRSNNTLTKYDRNYLFPNKDRKIFYGKRYYNVHRFRYGTIWNRLTRADMFTKGLYYLDEYTIKKYNSFLMVNRIGYIYLKDSKGEGHIRSGNNFINDKTIKEIILFFLFDYNLAYDKSHKSNIINDLRIYKKGKKHLKLSDLKSNFPPYKHLLELLINDKYVTKENKLFLLNLKRDLNPHC